jgi:thioredoxin 2
MADTYSPCPSCRAVNRVDLERLSDGKAPVCSRCKTPLTLEGAVSAVDGQGLERLIQSSPRPVLVDFWAPWCGPCRSFAPVFREAASRLAGEAVFAKLDTEQAPEIAGRMGIQAIPTLVLFQNGSERARQPGALPLDRLLAWLRQSAA